MSVGAIWRRGGRATGRRGVGAVLAVLAVLFAASASVAQITSEDPVAVRVKHIASQLRCPVCQGLSLQESQSELSMQMKGVIREQIESGKTDAQVIEYFVAKYGEWILLEPKPKGFNLAVYILPFVVLIGGIGVLFVSVKRWTAPPEHAAQP